MLYLPCRLGEDFQEKRGHLQCLKVGKEVYCKLFGMISFQMIQRHLYTLVCIHPCPHRWRVHQKGLEVVPFVPFELPQLQLL